MTERAIECNTLHTNDATAYSLQPELTAADESLPLAPSSRAAGWKWKHAASYAGAWEEMTPPKARPKQQPIRNNPHYVKRNQRCPCGSGRKFKSCCGSSVPAHAPAARPAVIDTGEAPICWVICNNTGTGYFSDADNKLLVFTDKSLAAAVANLPIFVDQEPGDINVVGIGPTKLAKLQNKLEYIEVSDIEHATQLITARIEASAPADPGQIVEYPEDR